MRDWLDSPLFYPKCQQPSSWSCTLDSAAHSTAAHSTAAHSTAAHSTVASQDTGMAMTLTGPGLPRPPWLTAPSGPGWRHRRRDRPERRACAALRDTRAAPGPAARRAGDPVRRSARGGRSTRGAAGILSRPANASPRRAVRWRTAVVRRLSQRQDSARLPEPSLTSLPDQPGLYGLTLLVDMPFIVRHKDRGALRLDHRHDQALCRRRATGSAKSFVIGVS